MPDRSILHIDPGRAPAPRPVTLRLLRPERGPFTAALYRPTRRERIQDWWHAHRSPLLHGALLWLSVLAMVVALNLLLAGANALADWLVAR